MRKVAVVLAGVALLAAGCKPGKPVLTPTAALHQIVDQPLSASTATAQATAGCLRSRGFDAPPPDLQIARTANLPVFITAEQAVADGYRDEAAGPSAFERFRLSLAPADRDRFDRAMDPRTGKPARLVTPGGWMVSASTRGCQAEARARVYGSVANWLLATYLPQDLNRAAARTLHAAAVAGPLRAYRRCMAAGGIAVDSPQQAHALAAKSTERAAPGNRIAVEDARCQNASDLRRSYMAAFDAACAPWLQSNATLILQAAQIVEYAAR